MRFSGLCLANLLRRFDEVRQFFPRVVGCDATTSVTEQVLAIINAHAFSPQPSSISVLQIMHTNVVEPVGAHCSWRFPHSSAARLRADFHAVLYIRVTRMHAESLARHRFDVRQRVYCRRNAEGVQPV